jgi:hypothetical protein
MFDVEQSKFVNEHPLCIFSRIKVMVLINMKLNWRTVSEVLPSFRCVEELILCRNKLTDYDGLILGPGELSNLRTLNLEETGNSNFEMV